MELWWCDVIAIHGRSDHRQSIGSRTRIMKKLHYAGLVVLTLIFGLLSLQIDTSLSLTNQWLLIRSPELAESFTDIFFVHSQLPRLSITILVGAMLGLVGSLMQQLTQNSLTSPLTLGTSSGAWLALVIVNIWFVDWVADYGALAAMVGALLAFGLIVMITGIRNMTGLPLVVSGMVVNILLGSIATTLVILNAQFAQNVFMWGAGDLAQYGWGWFNWLLPRVSIAIIILLLAPRILTLLRLGQEGATARGLAVLPAFSLLMIMGIWLVSASITAVGVISFIGLLTPNIARALGARTPREELITSLLLGASLLLITDSLSMLLGQWLEEVIPSGVTAAAIGAPALIWFSRRKLKAQDQLNISLAPNNAKLSPLLIISLVGLFVAGLVTYTFVELNSQSWQWAIPGQYQWQLRWPRIVTALFSGIALAVAGTLLQRILYNPLASPDILGVSSGATFALIITSLFVGSSMLAFHWGVALAGSLAVLALLLLLGKRHNFSPASVILTGIALTALLEALVQFFLAKGSADSYKILLWLAGSTYRVTGPQALSLALFVTALAVVAFGLSRWLTLISISRDFANARGLKAEHANIVLLVIVALMCAIVTSTMGPISFVGLVAPHMAMLLGAQKAKYQLAVGGLIGATLMLWADWLGQVILYPTQIAAGTLVAIIGGCYFLLLMTINRLK
ncbi:hypothetical iron(III) ABC transporter, permease protein [Photobacterium profundum SS9]|uniref:Hypothetical iron(III) ABC transporter, permease protein n=2 Tax=Photobacterium profundum TaxID=74109 RepID=Q6LRV2_PHOPR|nr:hypothetical iron(III) ABC transporter, permease protein [Photobacterium profundum SS9]